MSKNLRERKKLRTREALIDAATTLFLSKGFDATTADEIAEAAEISRSTFFRYFKTKEAVVFPYQAERIEMLRDRIRAHEAGHAPFAAVRRGLLDMARYFMDNQKELADQRRIISASTFLQARQKEFDAEWQEVIAERLLAHSGGRVGTERRARLVAGATFGLIEAVLQEWFDGGCEKDLLKLGRQGLDLLEAGVGSIAQFNRP